MPRFARRWWGISTSSGCSTRSIATGLNDPEIHARIRRNLELVRELNLILDFNVRPLFRGEDEPYVTESILKQAVEMGISLVPGDDSHGVETAGLNVDRAMDILREHGVVGGLGQTGILVRNMNVVLINPPWVVLVPGYPGARHRDCARRTAGTGGSVHLFALHRIASHGCLDCRGCLYPARGGHYRSRRFGPLLF